MRLRSSHFSPIVIAVAIFKVMFQLLNYVSLMISLTFLHFLLIISKTRATLYSVARVGKEESQ